MPIRTVEVPGVPADVEVRRSTRRRKTVSYFREEGRTVVVVPHRMTRSDIREHVAELLARMQRGRGITSSDAALAERAELLRRRYLPTVPAPSTVTWSARQQRRYGSCTTTTGAIRISTMLRGMPDYVLDSILIHELAHLTYPNHGVEFTRLIRAFPETEMAEAFLRGFEYGSQTAGSGHCQEGPSTTLPACG